MTPRPRLPRLTDDEVRLLSEYLDGEADARGKQLALACLAREGDAQDWLDAVASLGEAAREIWDEAGAGEAPEARVAEQAAAYRSVAAGVLHSRVNGVAARARPPRREPSET